jgi:ATP-dependent Clp protease ATP-binding subunit ClpB
MQLEIEREAIKREKDDRKVSELSEEIANLSATVIRYVPNGKARKTLWMALTKRLNR